jgi:hypothetical protein
MPSRRSYRLRLYTDVSQGQAVRFRVFCTLMLSVAIGAIAHLYFNKVAYTLSFPMIKELWDMGATQGSGGAIGGSLTELFTYLFSRVGAYIVLICAIIFLLLVSLNQTITGIVDAYRRRPRYEPEYAPVPETEPVSAKPVVPKTKNKVIDIPLDEPDPKNIPEQLKVKKHASFFNTHPNGKTPAEVLGAEPPEESLSVQADGAIQKDVPLDIPFMEKKPEKTPDKLAEKKGDTAPEDAQKAPPPKTEHEPNKSTYIYPNLDLLASGPSGRVDGTEEVRLNIDGLKRPSGASASMSKFPAIRAARR